MSNETGASTVDSTTSPATDHPSSSPPRVWSASATGTAAVPKESGQVPGEDLPPVQLERTSSVSDEYLRFLKQPGSVEKRFPVDRKKLERLIVAGSKGNESAEEFFQNIMEQTATLILWPSKLKIGAKSKKDPQVKVVGPSRGVQRARELILTDLDAKSNRITLKIDVPSTEHSHVIGKEGANIKKVHEETGCHIHFPDSNRSMQAEKSNQVSITGSVSSVELARKRIRELVPVVLSFTLSMPGPIDTSPPELAQLNLTYNVQIHIKPQPRQYSMLIVIRGTVKFLDGLKIALSKVVEYFTGDCHVIPPVNLNLDIAVQHHHTLIGPAGGNIRKIMQDTETTIQFPDPTARYHSTQVMIRGALDPVFAAREQLLGCLPVVLLFDIYDTEESKISSSLIGELMQQLDVFISVKPKAKQQTIQSVIIKSIEQNMQCVFHTRSLLLEYSNQPVPSVAFLPGSAPPERAVSPATAETEKTVKFKESGGRVLETSYEEPHLKADRSRKSPSPSNLKASKSEREPSPSTHSESTELSTPNQRAAAENKPPLVEVIPCTPTPTSTTATDLSSSGFSTASANPHRRLTTRSFLDWDKKKESAHRAKTSKVEPNEPRYPTHKWVGSYLSESMPAGSDHLQSPPSPPSSSTPASNSSSTQPQGLSSLNRHGFQALVRQASIEKTAELDIYQGVTDIPTLLQRIGLEKYQSYFEEEEVDFPTFLTMTEHDFREIGITTLGARRKLQIAVSELKKLQGKQGGAGRGKSAGAGRLPYQTSVPHQPPPGFNRSGSLKHSGNFSHSVRF